MLEEITTRVLEFVNGKAFWWWHGWLLSLNWLVLSFLGILVRKLSKSTLSQWIHILIFAFVDYTSLFLMGGAAYRLYGSIGNFFMWPIVFQVHVGVGLIVCVWSIVQHTMGIILHYKRTFLMEHKKSGKLLFIVARAEAALGWAIKMDMIMSAVSVTLIVAGSWVFMAMQQQQNKHKKVANKIE